MQMANEFSEKHSYNKRLWTAPSFLSSELVGAKVF